MHWSSKLFERPPTTKRRPPRLSQDTYWCHTVSVFTAFRPNRIGEFNTYLDGDLYALGSGSNCTVFIDHFGIPSIDMHFSPKDAAYVGICSGLIAAVAMSWEPVGRTPVSVIRCRSSLRSARTVLENAILTAVQL